MVCVCVYVYTHTYIYIYIQLIYWNIKKLVYKLLAGEMEQEEMEQNRSHIFEIQAMSLLAW